MAAKKLKKNTKQDYKEFKELGSKEIINDIIRVFLFYKLRANKDPSIPR